MGVKRGRETKRGGEGVGERKRDDSTSRPRTFPFPRPYLFSGGLHGGGDVNSRTEPGRQSRIPQTSCDTGSTAHGETGGRTV